MSKCIKITPKEVLEVEEWTKDDFIRKNETDGYALQTPEIWLHRNYKLTMFVLAHADETNGTSHLANLIFNRLYDDDGTEAKICGPVLICNEWDDAEQGFEMTDYNHVMNLIYRNSKPCV